ncbi:acetyltransferase [Streptomyces sp. AcH 505]|uniref:GNAT family N-acetyltransferase n=1 Tax=unclassified Streptomyces TaxID=2593676 RepID=UPI000591E581|nr:GNAT family protein [Streptomyces sp. NBC_00370]KIF70211.1 acetyltransferase [Streptomyces sp. AcH 505]
MADLKIRPAFRADEQELADLDREMWSPLHAVTPRPQAYEPFFDDRHPPENFLVAEVDGRLVGYVAVAPATALAANAHVRQIRGLVVDGRERGRGVGRALVRAAAGRARAQGARRLTLRVLGHNAPARRLYEAAGFVVEGVLPGEFFLDGRYVDDVLMGRTL